MSTASDNTAKWAVRKFGGAGLPVGFEYFTTNPNIPAGSLPLLGGVYSRTLYKDLWNWVQEQTGYLIEESEWQEKSAANEGNVPFYSTGDGTTTFRVPSLKCWVKGANGIEEVGSYLSAGLPTKSIVGMWLVKAYGTVTNVGSTDVAAIAQGLTRVENKLNEAVIVGTVIPYAGTSLPTGYLPCNGASVSRETYASLFGAIGEAYGSGDGSTTFNLPNLPKFVLDSGAVDIKTDDILALKDIRTITKGKRFTGFYRLPGAVDTTALVAYSYNGASDESCIAMGYNSGLSASMSINKNTNIQYIIKY